MTQRSPLLPLSCLVLLSSCIDHPPGWERQPYLDEWRVVAETPDAAAIEFLSIGDRETVDNFANRGDVEVVFDPAATGITVEMQRFTITDNQEQADAAFRRMEYWGYNSSSPEALDPILDAAILCFTPGNNACYVRAHFDGMAQPLRDGANFRVTLPAGWNGELEIVTSDNLGEGIEYYPDRSDVRVTGLSGPLSVDLDSGNVEIVLDSSIEHYAGCPFNDVCELGDPNATPPLAPFDPTCGCTYPTSVTIDNAPGQASDITIDLPTTSALTGEGPWYTVWLENEGRGFGYFACAATLDCDAFGPDCLIDPDFSAIKHKEWAEINYPGEPAMPVAGIQINATSSTCADVAYIEHPEDYGLKEFPHEQRGNLHVCSGCLR